MTGLVHLWDLRDPPTAAPTSHNPFHRWVAATAADSPRTDLSLTARQVFNKLKGDADFSWLSEIVAVGSRSTMSQAQCFQLLALTAPNSMSARIATCVSLLQRCGQGKVLVRHCGLLITGWLAARCGSCEEFCNSFDAELGLFYKAIKRHYTNGESCLQPKLEVQKWLEEAMTRWANSDDEDVDVVAPHTEVMVGRPVTSSLDCVMMDGGGAMEENDVVALSHNSEALVADITTGDTPSPSFAALERPGADERYLIVDLLVLMLDALFGLPRPRAYRLLDAAGASACSTISSTDVTKLLHRVAAWMDTGVDTAVDQVSVRVAKFLHRTIVDRTPRVEPLQTTTTPLVKPLTQSPTDGDHTTDVVSVRTEPAKHRDRHEADSDRDTHVPEELASPAPQDNGRSSSKYLVPSSSRNHNSEQREPPEDKGGAGCCVIM